MLGPASGALRSGCYRPGLHRMGTVSQLLSNALKLESLNGVWSLQQLHGWLFTALAFPQLQLSEAPAPGSNLGFFCYWVYLGLRAPGGYCFCVFFFFFCSDSSAHDKDLECSVNAAHPNLTHLRSVLAIYGWGRCSSPTR